MGQGRRIACLHVSALPLEALLRAEPQLRGAPVAIVDSDAARAIVLCAGAEARAAGVHPGMSAAAARAACAAVVLRPPSTGLVRSALDALCDLAMAHAPQCERTASGVLLSVGELAHLHAAGAGEAGLGAALWAKGERLGLRTQVGIAAGPRLAEVAARSGPGVTVVPAGEERRFLGALPLEALELGAEGPGAGPTLSEALAGRLRAWGVRRVADLAALPRPPLALRLGAAGVQLHRLACGEDDAPLRPTAPPPLLCEVLDLDDDIDNLEPLGFVLRGLLDRVVARLAVRGQALRDYTLRLDLSPRGQEQWPVQVAAPTRDVASLLRLGRAALQSLPPAAPVRRVAVICRPCAPRPAQLDLFAPAGPSPEQLSATLARVQALCGEDSVGAAVLPDSHLPSPQGLPGEPRVIRFPVQPAGAPPTPAGARPAARPAHGAEPARAPRLPQAQRLAPHVLRPPRPAEVILLEGRPLSLRADLAAGEVRRCSGPHRVRIGWGRPVLRDYFDVELEGGGLWRLFQDLASSAWFLDARYD